MGICSNGLRNSQHEHPLGNAQQRNMWKALLHHLYNDQLSARLRITPKTVELKGDVSGKRKLKI